MKLLKNIIFILFLTITLSKNLNSQCNTNISICQSGIAGPFGFGTGGQQVSTCLDWQSTSQFTYVVLYITQSGPLNLLIQGNGTSGFLDVAIFNVPQGSSPCNAILNNANQIGCNYASTSSACNQFGNSFPCASSVASPNVVAGQVLMIVVEDWMNGPSTNFTLQLGPPPSAQTGAPNTTIIPVGPFCTNSPTTQLQSVNMGGTWSGPGISSTGVFNPSVAGVGTHTITYSLGQSPCNSTSTTQITVNQTPIITPIGVNTSCFGICNGSATVNISNSTYLWQPGGLTTQTINNLCAGTYSVTVNQNGCVANGNVTITQPQPITTGPISHN